MKIKRHFLFAAAILAVASTFAFAGETSSEPAFQPSAFSTFSTEKTVASPEIFVETKAAPSDISFPVMSLEIWNRLKDQFAVDWSEPDTLNLSSFGVSLIWKGILPHGIDIHYQHEFQVIPHLAVKGIIQEEFFFDNGFSDLCLATSLAGWLEFFPMSNQMRRLYVGFGGAVDYFGFINTSFELSDRSGFILSFSPYVGYRFSLPLYFMLDVYVGYKFPYEIGCELSGLSEKFLGAGWQYGFSLTRTWSISKALKANRQAKKEARQARKETEKSSEE